MSWKWGMILMLLLGLVIFAVQNYEVVKVQFLVWSFETSRAIIIFSSLVVGVIIGVAASYIRNRKP